MGLKGLWKGNGFFTMACVLDVVMVLLVKSAVHAGGVLIGMATKQVLGKIHLEFDRSLLGGVGGTGRTRRMLEPCQCLRV
jgi:hypothetical protein